MLKIYKTIQNSILEMTSLEGQNLWVDLVNPTEEELGRICERFHTDIDLLKAPLDYEERPRIEAYDGQVLILISMPNFLTEESQILYNTIPLGIIVTEEVIITVALTSSMLIDQFLKSKIFPVTQKRTRFVLQMLYNNARLFLSCLKQIDKKSTEIEKYLHKSSKNKELINLLNLEKSLVYFTTSLRSNESVLEKLLRTYLRKVHDEESEITVRVLKKYEEDEDLLEDVITENKQAIDIADIYSNILNGTMDAFASIISNNLNIVMKFLASITIVMAIPTIITSFFGMNVLLPYQDRPFAYVGIIILTLVLMIIGALFITKKKMY
ncbi:magnesium transporter CorA family protein [Parasporobacterium paucivorans]|uniref:Magnesium transporter n=1 Tax=Parasporobacterium paucivorans DSM 15970 TaxID=1122934 RepID=A0A1M6HME5_9FIRM|nr:magnesium transporter CorA family protein [Parasporobacterium paucivorans]SHJ23340.1 magnesium transporter [Parasporobacterium paucivorans DSM 15970]